jgi:hypothetical protein
MVDQLPGPGSEKDLERLVEHLAAQLRHGPALVEHVMNSSFTI